MVRTFETLKGPSGSTAHLTMFFKNFPDVKNTCDVTFLPAALQKLVGGSFKFIGAFPLEISMFNLVGYGLNLLYELFFFALGLAKAIPIVGPILTQILALVLGVRPVYDDEGSNVNIDLVFHGNDALETSMKAERYFCDMAGFEARLKGPVRPNVRIDHEVDNFFNHNPKENPTRAAHVPSKLVTLMSGEEVKDTLPHYFPISIMDWILCVLTLGLFYVLVIGPRKRMTGATYFTDRRIGLGFSSGKRGSSLVNFNMSWFIRDTRYVSVKQEAFPRKTLTGKDVTTFSRAITVTASQGTFSLTLPSLIKDFTNDRVIQLLELMSSVETRRALNRSDVTSSNAVVEDNVPQNIRLPGEEVLMTLQHAPKELQGKKKLPLPMLLPNLEIRAMSVTSHRLIEIYGGLCVYKIQYPKPTKEELKKWTPEQKKEYALKVAKEAMKASWHPSHGKTVADLFSHPHGSYEARIYNLEAVDAIAFSAQEAGPLPFCGGKPNDPSRLNIQVSWEGSKAWSKIDVGWAQKYDGRLTQVMNLLSKIKSSKKNSENDDDDDDNNGGKIGFGKKLIKEATDNADRFMDNMSSNVNNFANNMNNSINDYADESTEFLDSGKKKAPLIAKMKR